MNTRSVGLLGVALVVVVGCPSRELGPVAPIVQSGTKVQLVSHEDAVDLLVMVDNSNSMKQEQDNLTASFDVLVGALTQPPDGDQPVTDLHIGVISSDMGTGGHPIETCDRGDGGVLSGDDGVLRTEGHPDLVAGCDETYPSFLQYRDGDDTAVIDHEFSCVATLGTGGCGFEQQLGAVRKALTVHADGPNHGFLREDSILAILMVTDEEDCTVRSGTEGTDMFSSQDLGDPNLRCYRHGARFLEPVETFVADLLALRPQDPGRLVVAAIVGIPPDARHDCNLEGMDSSDFQCLLDLPAMQETIDNSPEGDGRRLVPSCDEPDLGLAFPPRRIVELVRQINDVGNSGIVRSICEADYTPALEAITRLIRGKVLGTCVARPIEPLQSGAVPCLVQETLSDDRSCGPGRIGVGLRSGGRVCQVCQQGDGTEGRRVDELGTDLSPCAAFQETGDYWRYEPAGVSADCVNGGVVFDGGTEPEPDSVVSFECLSQIGREPSTGEL